MKTITPIILSLSICLITACSETNSDKVEKGRLKDKAIKEIIAKNKITNYKKYELKPINEFGITKYDSILVEENQFSQSGNVIRETYYFINDEGRAYRKTIKEFNETGKLKYEYEAQDHSEKEISFTIDYGDNEYTVLKETHETFYNDQGRKAQIFTTYDNVHKFTSTYNWLNDTCYIYRYVDPLGNLVNSDRTCMDSHGNTLTVFSLPDNIQTDKSTYVVDNKGNYLVKEYMTPYLSARQEFDYDKKGNKIESRYYELYKEGPELTQRTTYKYDDNGNTIEIIDYKQDGSHKGKREAKHTYDNKGNLIETVWYSDGQKEDTYSKTYNENNLLVKEVGLNHKNNTERIESRFYNSITGLLEREETSNPDKQTITVHLYQ